MAYTYEHPRPSVTVDCIVLKYNKSAISILLIKRGNDPFKNQWALPGGFLDMDESPEVGVQRELKEETGLEVKEVIQIGAFGKPDRDPRGRVISISFLSIVKAGNDTIKAASDASEVRWFSIHDLPNPLAFDHKEIIEEALKFLREKLKMSMINLLPFFDLSIDEVQSINLMITEK